MQPCLYFSMIGYVKSVWLMYLFSSFSVSIVLRVSCLSFPFKGGVFSLDRIDVTLPEDPSDSRFSSLSSVVRCAAACTRDSSCVAFVWNVTQRYCIAVSSDHFGRGLSFHSEAGTVFYSRTAASNIP